MMRRITLAVVLLAAARCGGATTARADALTPGDPTSLDPREAAESARIADQIRSLAEEARRGAPQFSMIGEATGSGAHFAVNGEAFTLNDSTVISGKLAAGKLIEVRGVFGPGGALIARQIVVHETTTEPGAPAGQRLTPNDARRLR